MCQTKPPQTEENAPIFWVKFDLSGALSELNALLPERIDAVIHLAQSPFFRNFLEQAEYVFNVNVNATMYLLNLARTSGCTHFINASSGAVYAFSEQLLEEDGVELLKAGCGFYPASKQCGELIVNAYANLMNTVNLRFFFIYGRGLESSMLIPRLVGLVRQGSEINLQGSDGLRLNPVHASDAAKAVIRCLELDGSHTINVAGKDSVSLRQVGLIIGQALGLEAKFNVDSDQQAANIVADISTMQRLLVEPYTCLVDGKSDYCRSCVEA